MLGSRQYPRGRVSMAPILGCSCHTDAYARRCASHVGTLSRRRFLQAGAVAGAIATSEIIASLEYGAAVLGTKAIVVMSHSKCGAVKATIEGKAVPGQISALYRSIRPAVDQAGPDLEAASRANAKIQVGLLSKSSPVMADLIKKKQLKIAAAHYDIATGKVAWL